MSKRDTTRWAKKFDTVAHLYAPSTGGTICGSVAHCLGNNYAHTGMETCPECLDKFHKREKNDDNYIEHEMI